MANSNLIKALAKVIVAAAWADGNVTHDEINSLKDLLFHLPNLNATEWAELDMYIDAPVTPAERERLVDDLLNQVNRPADRQLAIDALNAMIHADGNITPEEEQVFNAIKDALANHDTSLIAPFKRLFTGPISRRSAAANVPNRERYFEDFIRNRVYYDVQRRLRMGEGEKLAIEESKLRKLSLAAGVMARVARVDKHIDQREFDVMVQCFRDDWHLSAQEATFIVTVATSDETAKLDPFRTAREFFDKCTQQELVDFAKVLFHVAAADGKATRDEIEEIRTISNTLLLSHQQYIEAKTSIPRELRED
jgi:uncharacterized tellurite resistance protein B-like protein